MSSRRAYDVFTLLRFLLPLRCFFFPFLVFCVVFFGCFFFFFCFSLDNFLKNIIVMFTFGDWYMAIDNEYRARYAMMKALGVSPLPVLLVPNAYFQNILPPFYAGCWGYDGYEDVYLIDWDTGWPLKGPGVAVFSIAKFHDFGAHNGSLRWCLFVQEWLSTLLFLEVGRIADTLMVRLVQVISGVETVLASKTWAECGIEYDSHFRVILAGLITDSDVKILAIVEDTVVYEGVIANPGFSADGKTTIGVKESDYTLRYTRGVLITEL